MGGEIVVVATRLQGQLEGTIPQQPVVTLDEQDVASYGATSIADLVTALSPQTSSGRGRGGGFPVILVNGRRIANFREIRNFPPEAIRRVEVMPEEVALRFGYPPNQRVINFILKDHYSARTVQVQYQQPQRGGTSTIGGQASLLTINGPRRFNVTLNGGHTTLLTEAERGVIQAAGSVPTVSGDPDSAAARSLVARSTNYGGNATWSTALGQGASAASLSLNAALTNTKTFGLSGLNTVLLTAPGGATALRTFGDPLARRTDTTTLEGGAVLAKPLGTWRLSVTADGSHAVSTSLIDRRADASALAAAARAGTLAITGPLPAVASSGTDRAHTVSDSLTTLATMIGQPIHLPAGDVSTTFKLGFAYTSIASDDTRTTAGPTHLHRGDLSAGINVGIPLTSRRNDVLAAVGDFNLNFSAGIDRLSDFGTLTDWSAGLTWSPTERLSFGASYIVNQSAPSLANLGNPQVQTFNVPVYDFTRGETALVTVISGGNPALVRETQRDIKLSANWQVPILRNSNLIVEYFRNRSSNVTAAFPLLTPAIEAAFPGRVVRDPNGRLVSIDQRPVTLFSEKSSRLRYGINIGGNIGPAPARRGGFGGFGGGGGGGRRFGGSGGSGGGGGPGGAGGGGGFGGGGFGGRGGGQGRWNIGLYHTIQFTNAVVVAPGGPLLDLLHGDALTGGGVARHTLELDAGAFYKGFGVRLSGTYASATHVRGSGAPGSSDLRFGSLTKINLRLFSDLGQQKALTDTSSFFKNARLSVFVNNLLDQRQRVTDANGIVPLSYQPDLIDPLGRVFGIEFRKMF
ncbi:MAG: TonB-dependent receptor [Novosphingobium sp.]|nr:TonB-dependent receptor [Novosphingobium sp.]